MRADGSLTNSLPWTTGALLVAYLPLAMAKPVWVSLLVLTCALLRLYMEFRRLRLMPAWIRTPIGIACFIAVLQAYGGINGVGPGGALLSVMAALKLLETHNQRDQFVLLFICLFMVLASFLQEQHLWSLGYLFGAFTLILAAWSAVAREGAALPGMWHARQAGHAMLLALPVLLAMWILFPRVPGPFWAIPTETSSGNTGLSSTMSPGDISKLSESSAVAFRARFEGAPPAQGLLYWRAIVMHRFDGRSWSADEPVYSSPVSDSINGRGDLTNYSVTMEPTNQRWLFALDMPGVWQGRGIYLSRFQTLQRVRPIDERLVYSASSYLNYTASPRLSARAQAWYTEIPANGNEQARQFAEDTLASTGSPEAMAQALLAYFREQAFYYTLSPPPLGRDSVDEFVFSTRRGFCEHYASAFTYMMRAAGVPARIVAGYQGGEQNPLGDYMIVRQSDAHAWSEIWLEGRGWVRFDPTAAVAPQRIEQDLESALREFGERVPGAFDLPLLDRLQLTWDVINARWNEWVLGFGPETQRDFFEWLGLDDPDWLDLTTLLAISLVTIMTLIASLLWWQQRPPQRDAASRRFAALQRRLRLPAATGEAPLAWARRAAAAYPADADAIDSAVRFYLQARYANNKRALNQLRVQSNRVRRRLTAAG